MKLNIAKQFINANETITEVLDIIKLSRSMWYYYNNKTNNDLRYNNKGRKITNYSYNIFGEQISDQVVIEYLKKYRNNRFFINGGGYRKLHYYLKRNEGVIVNHKKLYRLCKENNLLLKTHKKFKKFKKFCINRKLTKPHQVWEFDIKYGYLQGENRWFFILTYIDVFSRVITGAYIGLTCKAHNLAATLSLALKKWELNENELIIRSDNGPQMTSNLFKDYLANLQEKINHEFIPYATPNKDAHIEAFYSIIEIEFLRVNYFNDFAEAYKLFYEFIDFYNNNRIHSSIRYKTPMEIINIYKTGGNLNNIKRISI